MGHEPETTHILTVSQLTDRIKVLLEGGFPEVWVAGEISNLGIPQSGHAYFTLKDERCQLRAVLFRSAQRFLKFTLQHGMQVICRGRVAVYEPRGEYQLILDYIEPKGVGALQLAYEQLRLRLEREGLFAPARKKPLPVLPRRIGIVTSPTGAALRDMLRVIKRRHPRMQVIIYPVPVQGPDAAPAIVAALGYFNRQRAADVLIVGRGGGSLEDLWAFNEESVARAVFASRIPVVSAVGHETDYTIADFVADLRAATPSVAAEMVVRSEEAFRTQITALDGRLLRGMHRELEVLRADLHEKERLLGDPRRGLVRAAQRADELFGRLAPAVRHHFRRERTRLEALAAGLAHLNPLAILARGYSITSLLPGGKTLTSSTQTRAGDRIATRLFRGVIVSRVESRDP